MAFVTSSCEIRAVHSQFEFTSIILFHCGITANCCNVLVFHNCQVNVILIVSILSKSFRFASPSLLFSCCLYLFIIVCSAVFHATYESNIAGNWQHLLASLHNLLVQPPKLNYNSHKRRDEKSRKERSRVEKRGAVRLTHKDSGKLIEILISDMHWH